MFLLAILDSTLQVILENGKTVDFSGRNLSLAFISALQTDVINSAQTQICITLTSDWFAESIAKMQPIVICVFKLHSRG